MRENHTTTPTSEFRQVAEFDDYAMVAFVSEKTSGLSAVVAIHRMNSSMPAFGATRICHYASPNEGVTDALRLARLMSYKAALAGLPCGGAKGVIMTSKDPRTLTHAQRVKLLTAYAARINLLGGNFITGTDVGISQSDLRTMCRASSHIVGLNDNSTEFTVLGVYESIKVVLTELFGSADFKGHSFAIQGLGKIGEGILASIYAEAGVEGEIFVSDITAQRVKKLKKKYPRIIVVSPTEIDRQKVDVLIPCALSSTINQKNVRRLTVKAIVGGANNQLENEDVGDFLHKRHILYAPDYVVNAGGIIAVFDEYANKKYSRVRVEKAVLRIPTTLQHIFSESRKKNVSPARIANRMAETILTRQSDLI